MPSDSKQPAALAVPTARFFTRQDCSLCDRARAILTQLSDEGLLTFDSLDIMTHPSLAEHYGQRIPVIELSTGVRIEGRISEFRLRQLLARP
jgi:hypothetical protein